MRRYIIDALAALLVTALLCAIVYLIICLAQLANAARGAVEALPGRVDAAIAREAEATRAVLHAEAGAWRRMVDQQATAARRAAQDESAAYRGTLDARAGEIIGQAAAELRDTRLLLEGPAAELESTLAEYRRGRAVVGRRRTTRKYPRRNRESSGSTRGQIAEATEPAGRRKRRRFWGRQE